MTTSPSLNSDQLGHVIGEFGWNKGRAKFLLGVWIFMLILSLPLSLFLIGLPGLFLSGYFVLRSLRRLNAKTPIILLYQQGLMDCRQSPSTVIRYGEIKNLFLSVVIINGVLNYVIKLETQNGRSIKIDEHVAQVDQLRIALEEQVVQAQLPGAIAQVQQGLPLTFGPLSLTSEGLTFRQRQLPWAEFESTDVQRRSNSVEVIIRQQGNSQAWFTGSRDTFPNLALFFSLVPILRQPSGGV